MNKTLIELEPSSVWHHFEQLNAIPRASKKETQVIAWLKKFATERQLDYRQDAIGNIVIYKPATKGLENPKTVVLQAHVDMVHQKNQDTNFDFDTQGIVSEIKSDGWVYAKGTTLGADNGIGVATILATLASNSLTHPNLEAFFTIDEETGMTGALEFDPSLLSGDYLLNLDTEEDTDLTIGCAGAVNFDATRTYASLPIPKDYTGVEIQLKGLQGGHSGTEIHLGFANAIKLMARFLDHLTIPHYLVEFRGGNLRNVIPREANATIAIPNDKIHQLETIGEKFVQVLLEEYSPVERKIRLNIEPKAVNEVVVSEDYHNILKAILGVHVGVFKRSNTMPDLVETSGNLASIELAEQKVTIAGLLRSSLETSLQYYKETYAAPFELADFEVRFSGEYPAWTPKLESTLVNKAADLYQELFQEKMNISVVHAGLECGLLLKKCPKMEAISFGPNIRGAHSPEEKVEIASVQKFWKYYTKLLSILN